MIDLSTRYLGLTLKSPLVCSSSPLCKDIANLIRMEDCGAGAVVLHSLFEEQILIESASLDRMLSDSSNTQAEAQSYFPDLGSYGLGPKSYLDHLSKAKQVLRIPVIASLNGVSSGGWIRYAKEMEDAGADALELNIYFLPTSFDVDGADIERSYCELVHRIKEQVKIPLAVKLAPYFTSMSNIAKRLESVGADALVLFNRFYQPDFDLESLEVLTAPSLSTSEELRLRLHWVALLSTRVRPDLAITGGVHTAEDVLKSVMAGAHAVMMTSALLKNGIGHLTKVTKDLIDWMELHQYESIRQMRGSMNAVAVAEPGAYERANYLKVLSSYTMRTGAR
jgi:dihydroorotate dehydrogenase (fumarate)